MQLLQQLGFINKNFCVTQIFVMWHEVGGLLFVDGHCVGGTSRWFRLRFRLEKIKVNMNLEIVNAIIRFKINRCTLYFFYL